MKMVRSLFCTLLPLFMFASCNNGNEGPIGFEIADEYKNITITGMEEKPFHFTAHSDWNIVVAYPKEITADEQWLSVSKEEGEAGEIELTVKALEKNPAETDRKCSIMLYSFDSGIAMASAIVTQKGELKPAS